MPTQKQVRQADMSPLSAGQGSLYPPPDKHTLHHAETRAVFFPRFMSATLGVLWGLITPVAHSSHAKEVALATQGEISSYSSFYYGSLFPKEERLRY